MKTRNVILICAVAVAMLSVAVSASWAVPLLPITTVNDLGNAPDVAGYGSVNYSYGIGQTEVTNGMYAEFLSSVARTSDNYGLFNISMTTDPRGGILRNGLGTPASPWQYVPKTNSADRPVTFVSWYDAVRYSNYMTNKAQALPMSTETGAYPIINGGIDSGNVTVPTPAQRAIWANPLGQIPPLPYKDYYVLPTENEWYKAAYYKAGGLSAGYWKYPTRSNTPPASQLPPGAATGAANYTMTGAPLDPAKYTTLVGAYTPSPSAYGTKDQGGNVWEWTESPYSGNMRIARGGAFDSMSAALSSSMRATNLASANLADLGFRVVLVPEPSTLVMLLGSAALALVWWLRRRV